MVSLRFGRSLIGALAAAAALMAGVAHAGDYKAPRNKLGQPDLQGIWTNTALTFLERMPIFKSLVATDAEAAQMEKFFNGLAGDLVSDAPIDPGKGPPPKVKNAPNADFIEMDLHLGRIDGKMVSSWIVDPPDGKIPFTDAGRKAVRDFNKESFDGPEGRPITERCLISIGSTEGPPMMNGGFNGHYQIVQTRHFVAILVEMNHDVRIIRMNARGHLPPSVRPWMGDSIGWWEGDTLVVETTNFEPRTFIGSLTGGFVYSDKARVTERLTRTGPEQMFYEFEVEDPVMFTRPWRAMMPYRTAKGPIYEYACHEGNYSLGNALSGAREQEKLAAAAAPGAGK
jgi:hypothetical protein